MTDISKSEQSLNNILNKLGIKSQDQAAKSGNKSKLGQEDFLKLMTTQLQNQDPFAPMENGDFIAFSSYLDFGIVRVYKEINNAWVQVGSDINGEYYYEQYGGGTHRTYVSISNDGNAIAIGSPDNDNDNGTNSGHVRIFENINNNWTQVGNDIQESGDSLSIGSDGSIIAIGLTETGDDNSVDLYTHGDLRIYKNVHGTWTKVVAGLGYGTTLFKVDSVSLIKDNAVTDLPEPDSPTIAIVSPLLMLKEMPSTAFTTLSFN